MFSNVENVLFGDGVPKAYGAALAGGAKKGGPAAAVLDARHTLTLALVGNQRGRQLKGCQVNQHGK